MSFDLNLNNYKLTQIVSFFGYKDTDVITYDDLSIRSEGLRTQLIQSGRIPSASFDKFEHFLSEATRWVAAVKCATSAASNASTTSTAPVNKEPPPMKKDSIAQTVLPPPTRSADPALLPNPYVVPTTLTMGTRNPLQNQTIQKYMTIDSRHRDNYYTTAPSDFTFSLPERMSNVVDMRLTAFEIPMSFYNISASLFNHYFGMTLTYTPTQTAVETSSRIVVIPDGNYNAPDLIQTINRIVAPRDADGELVYPNNAYSYVSFSLDITDSGGGTGKVTVAFTPTDRFALSTMELHFGSFLTGEPNDRTELAKKLGWALGFQQREYVGGQSYIGESIVDPGFMRYMYLAVDDFQRAVSNTFISTHIPPDVLARITVKGTHFSLLMSDNLNYVAEPRRYFGPVQIRKLRIRLLDDWGRPVQMNAANFSLCITFTVLYDMVV